MSACDAVVIIQTRKLNEINLEDTEKKSKRDSYVDSSKSLSLLAVCTGYIEWQKNPEK